MLPKAFLKKKQKIIIVDFGSQVTKLIARRIRDLNVYCEIINLKDLEKIKNFEEIKGIILSGGPSTVTKKKYPKIPKFLFEKDIPILGICYGLQLIAKFFGGQIKKSKKKREFGRALLITSCITCADTGASSEGLIAIVFPAAMAGIIGTIHSAVGALYADILSTTPLD